MENAEAWSARRCWGSVMFGTTPKAPRCLNCIDRCNSFAKHHAMAGCPDLYSFYCLACDEWHVKEGEAVRLVSNSQDVAARALVLRREPRNVSRCIGRRSREAPQIVPLTIHLVVAPLSNSVSL